MNKSKPLHTIGIQIVILIGILMIAPLMIYVFTGDHENALSAFISVTPATFACFVIFMINYWWWIPKFYYQDRKYLYFTLNILMLIFFVFWALLGFLNSDLEASHKIFIFTSSVFITLMLLTGANALAVALLNSQRNKILHEQMIEEKRRHTEAELIWLKNQINPHFLFNTLNNISALVALDTDLAQDSISRLSDLLRYAMYESSKPEVPLSKEVDFMKDYISLMKLRCSNKTVVATDFELESPTIQIAPLLLISLIENAFKHGVSSNLPSEIDISLKEKSGILIFKCVNTNHAKSTADKSGSGIGLGNMRQRMDLLYSGKYSWTQTCDENLFSVIVKMEL